jgi:HD-GYP domain-containing protein (c-di-GMP phosphodiesterase class II)
MESTALDCDLYVQHAGREFAELYKERNYPLAQTDLDRLIESGIDHLYIRWEDKESYRDYLHEHFLSDKCVPQPARLRALREVTRVAFEDALRHSRCDRMVAVAGGFGHDLAAMLADQTPVFQELFKTLDHDYYTFTHACNVSTYCAVIAVRMGICDSVELAQLAAGGILHDIGKRHIPVHILNKCERLTEQEWELVRRHPVTGYQDLADRGDLTEGQLMMVYQHHERLDGSGYPDKARDADIHPWAKICAVADVFDAMTCKRPYRDAVPLKNVAAYFRRFSGVQFAAEVVNCWTAEFSESLTPAT